MECVGDCGCGSACQNQRFQRKQYADVAVIKTEKKGFGLRANGNLKPGDFIFEYIGEVIDERSFRRRMHQYDDEGIKHFYFMSLTKNEFVDATKKGNLGRFCNHSCNPNCYVDKWVVGDKLRMGIFAERKIKAGEELVFNYNVDRYGADPQPCYCGEPNCTGFIGGRTQTENATKLSHATIEALGIDGGDGWDTAVAKKPRRKKAHEDDEEYINDIKPKSLEESGVNKVMAALRQCTEKWVAVKLLSRIQDSGDDEKVGHRVIRVHGYEILKSTIVAWKDDANVILQALDILHRLPRITRNKIQDSNIEETIEDLKTFDDERVQSEAVRLLEAWSKLKVAYRIPRFKRDPNASTPLRGNRFERREKGRERSQSRPRSPSIAAPKGPAVSTAPTGPRSFQRNTTFNGLRPPRPRPTFNPLPPGWFQATSADNGAIYYYNSSGVTQWTRPTLSTHTPPPQPKSKTNEQKLQEIISSITQSATSTTPQPASANSPAAEEPDEDKTTKSERWKKLPQDKQEKLYEATVSKAKPDPVEVCLTAIVASPCHVRG
jgi:histone-lysine N-methyltransferase SETD2